MIDIFLYQNFIILIFHLTFLISISSSSSSYNHYSSIYSSPKDKKFSIRFLERLRTQRDTYDEREKLLSTYKIISKTQCLLQMRSFDGYVYAKHINNLDDIKETQNGIFLFLPIGVNLFLIQHKESKRYLCGRNNQLFGLNERNERECLFEIKRSNIDFGYWDSYRLFYENSNHGYLSISYKCQTRLRKKYSNDNYLDFLAFLRINTDVSTTRYIINQNRTKLLNNYRQQFMNYINKSKRIHHT